MYLSIYRSIHPSIDLSIDLFVYLSIYLSIYRSIYLSIYHYLSLSIYLPTHTFSCLNVDNNTELSRTFITLLYCQAWAWHGAMLRRFCSTLPHAGYAPPGSRTRGEQQGGRVEF